MDIRIVFWPMMPVWQCRKSLNFALNMTYSSINGAQMTDKESRDLIKLLQEVADEYSSTPEKAKQFLIESGVLTESGELAEPHRS